MGPRKKIISFTRFTWCAIFFAIFLSSCGASKEEAFQVSRDEKKWLHDFFSEIMLDKSGVFTLWGSKPLTAIIIDHFTEEEMAEWVSTFSKEELKECRILESYDLPEHWEKWKQVASRFPMKRYLLFEAPWYSSSERCTSVFFVDVLKMALVLQENYEFFKNMGGMDFDPSEEVFEMEKASSPFWQAFRQNSTALHWGILFGYGKENAYAFYWKHFAHPKKLDDFFISLQGNESDQYLTGKVTIGLNNFELPSFVSFFDQDPVVERYKKEREQIKQTYKRDDFLQLTLKRLTE